MMKRTFLGVMAAMLLIMAASSRLNAQRAPSTPEERAKALALIHHLDADPFAEDADDARDWLIAWVTEIPDIRVKICAEVLRPIADINDRDGGAILAAQFLFISVGYMIEHPDSAMNDTAVNMAGLEGMLRVYTVMVDTREKKRNKMLETLVEQQKSGKLAGIVAEQVAHCKDE